MITSDNPKAARWQQCIATGARLLGEPRFTDAVAVALLFRMPRPKRLPKGITQPVRARSGDIDKLARLALDALTGTLLDDDVQVCELHARKVFVSGSDAPGVRITVGELPS